MDRFLGAWGAAAAWGESVGRRAGLCARAKRARRVRQGPGLSVDAVTLAARLGHADPAFTARTYIHRDDDRARALADLADGLRLPER